MKKLVNSIKSKRKTQNGPSSSSKSVPVPDQTVKNSEDVLLREESATTSGMIEAELDGAPDRCIFDMKESATPARVVEETSDNEPSPEEGIKSASEVGQQAHSGAEVNTISGEAADKHEPHSRIEMVQQSLIEASNSLSETLKVYINSPKAEEDGRPLAALIANDANLLDGSGPVTAEQLSRAVEAVLLKQQGQKPSLASKVGSAIGKLFPLASLALGLGANAAEVSHHLLRWKFTKSSTGRLIHSCQGCGEWHLSSAFGWF